MQILRDFRKYRYFAKHNYIVITAQRVVFCSLLWVYKTLPPFLSPYVQISDATGHKFLADLDLQIVHCNHETKKKIDRVFKNILTHTSIALSRLCIVAGVTRVEF